MSSSAGLQHEIFGKVNKKIPDKYKEKFIGIFGAYEDAISERVNEIESRIKKLMKKKNYAFTDYSKFPYHLHAIIIHDGHAKSGHYYSFIFDQKNDCWWRFNDHTVTTEKEDIVM